MACVGEKAKEERKRDVDGVWGGADWNAREKRQMHHTAHNRTVSFLVENDMIGRLFDTHGGLVQTLTCTIDFLGPRATHSFSTHGSVEDCVRAARRTRSLPCACMGHRRAHRRTLIAFALAGPLGCHMLESTICNLIQHCQNDPRWSTCEFSYHAEPVVEGSIPCSFAWWFPEMRKLLLCCHLQACASTSWSRTAKESS